MATSKMAEWTSDQKIMCFHTDLDKIDDETALRYNGTKAVPGRKIAMLGKGIRFEVTPEFFKLGKYGKDGQGEYWQFLHVLEKE